MEMTSSVNLYSFLYSAASYLGISLTIYLVVGFLALLFLFRVIRTVIGERFSGTWLFLTPAFYSVLVLTSFISSSTEQQIFAAITAAIGIGYGLKLSKKDEVYDKKNQLYYRKSLTITFLWSLFFSVKMLTYLYYPQYNFQTLFTALLTLVTGIIAGEAFRIYHRGHIYRKGIA